MLRNRRALAVALHNDAININNVSKSLISVIARWIKSGDIKKDGEIISLKLS